MLAIFLLQAALASAWMPGVHKDVTNSTGSNLFKRSDTNPEKRWLPASPNSRNKIRGVDLGSLFVFEPWLAWDTWQAMGCVCNGQQCPSEFDCVNQLGQAQANTVFQNHWATWITQDDFTKMASYGLNTVRIPVGYWMYEDLVYDSEHFPQGGFDALKTVCNYAKNAGFFVIIDLHGAPDSQSAGKNADTGQYCDPGFYDNSDAYSRAEKFLNWMTTQIHTNTEFANVGMLEVLNEPIQDTSRTGSMLSDFYPNAWSTIRAAENAIAGMTTNNQLHIQYMNQQWGSGNPNQDLGSTWFTSYDDHRYLKWAGVADEQSAYLQTSCTDNRNQNTPTIVGEWSLSTNNNEWDPSSNQQFYQNWWAAQIQTYEQTDGWIFWTWKTSGLNDPRWDYQLAVQAGIIDPNPDNAYNNGICNNY